MDPIDGYWVELAELGEQKAAGCVAFTDDGRPVATALLMRRALEYARMLGVPIVNHCEDPSLKGDGVAHEGYVASQLGLRGIPGEAESIMVERDISLAELTGAHVHVAHMSAHQSLRAVRAGKERGVRVTCEVAPHHFTLTDESLDGAVKYDTNFKMNPPLRASADRDAMLDGIADGSVDVIATDHAPHHVDEKMVEFDRAPFGIVGLETAVPIVFDRLVQFPDVSEDVREAHVQFGGIGVLADRFATSGLRLLKNRVGFGGLALRAKEFDEGCTLPTHVVAVVLLTRLGR